MAVNNTSNNNIGIDITHDIWFHIAMWLDPEDVQTFALICKQTAKLVSSRAFWRNMYKRYCLGGSVWTWNLNLPAQLQLEQIRNCDTKALRALVTESLFHCYRPLKDRLDLGYSLDWLLQRTVMSCSDQRYQCMWIMCYTFCSQQGITSSRRMVDVRQTEGADKEVANDWETLVDADDEAPALSFASRNDGVFLLIVICRKYMPLPTQLLYNQQQTRFCLQAARERLCVDMRTNNLELDFVENTMSSSQLSVTVKYPRIEKYKVLPWWHPDFKRFFK